jgi:predicted metalloendopeptidase
MKNQRRPERSISPPGQSFQVVRRNGRESYSRCVKSAGARNTACFLDATKEQSRGSSIQYNPKTLAELSKLTTSINWKTYFGDLKIAEDTIIVTEPKFMVEYEKVIKSYSLDDIKTYLKSALLRGSAPLLNNAFVQEAFDFNTKVHAWR